MEIPLSQDSIHMTLEDSGCQDELFQVRIARPGQDSSAGSDYV